MTAADEDLLLRWANDPTVRAMARSTAPISFDQHRFWFHKKLGDAACRIWICQDDAAPVGQIRLERSNDTAEIDISVAPEARGKGIGLFMLNAPEITDWPGLQRLRASVRHGNAASLSVFRRAGFSECGRDDDFVRFEKDIQRAAPR